MAKIKVRQTETAEETFARFLLVKRAEGIAEKTVSSYSGHFRAISKHLDTTRDIRSISNSELERMIVSMREQGLSPNSIETYTVTLKVFYHGAIKRASRL